jgi:hypothetical protein
MPKPKAQNETLANFRIDRDKWRAFIDRCSREGLSASEKIKAFVDGYLAGTVDTTPSPQDSRVTDLMARMDEVERRLGKLKPNTERRQQKLINRFFQQPTTPRESPRTS